MEITQKKIKELNKLIKDNGVYLSYLIYPTTQDRADNKHQIHTVDPSAQHNLIKAIEQAPEGFDTVEIVYSHDNKPIWHTDCDGLTYLDDQGCKDLPAYAKSMEKVR